MIDPPRSRQRVTEADTCSLVRRLSWLLFAALVLWWVMHTFELPSLLPSGECELLPQTQLMSYAPEYSPDGPETGEWNVRTDEDASVPCPSAGEVLAMVRSSSVNPTDWFEAMFQRPALGLDVAGTLVSVGGLCASLGWKVGDEVWGMANKYIGKGSYQQFALLNCRAIGRRAPGSPMPLREYGVLPVVAGTAYEVFVIAGAPWTAEQNITVAIASGSGGTGTVAIQMAKALGAARVVTAASPTHHALLRSLGADVVVDYHRTSLWTALGPDSVDVVWDNYGELRMWEAAMPCIRAGGYAIWMVTFFETGGSEPRHVKPGVTSQFYRGFYSTGSVYEPMSRIIEAGQLRAVVQRWYPLSQVADAWRESVDRHVAGKLGIDVPYPERWSPTTLPGWPAAGSPVGSRDDDPRRSNSPS